MDGEVLFEEGKKGREAGWRRRRMEEEEGGEEKRRGCSFLWVFMTLLLYGDAGGEGITI